MKPGQGIEHGLRRVGGNSAIFRVTGTLSFECRKIESTVAKQIMRRHGVRDQFVRRYGQPLHRAYHGVGQCLNRIRILANKAVFGVQTAGRQRGAIQVLCALFADRFDFFHDFATTYQHGDNRFDICQCVQMTAQHGCYRTLTSADTDD